MRKPETNALLRVVCQVEWPTIGMLLLCYGGWFAAGYYIFPVHPVLALAGLSVAVALHSSLQHEVLHGHPTPNRVLNELLVALPLSLAFPYRRFKSLHLKHHADARLTDPYYDPESFYHAAEDWQGVPVALKWLLRWNNTLIGRILVGPALAVLGFLRSETRLIGSDRKVRTAWILHALGLAVLVLLLRHLFGIPVWLYALTAAYGGLSIIAIRSFCEHQWSENEAARSVIVERSPLALIFLNNNLHLVHHKLPTAPWYRLPGLYAERREEWRAMNQGYVFPNYGAILRSFAFRRKEPLIHPALPSREGEQPA